jgi:hypothetical protein
MTKALRVAAVYGCIVALATLAACSSDAGPTTPAAQSLAYTRFVNAVVDSGPTDWRFIDQIENSPTTFGLTFRQTFPGAGYQATGSGSRHLRVFPTTTDINLVSTVLFDTTFNFEQGAHYTIMAAGALRSGAPTKAQLYIFKDDFTDPGSGILVRALNAGATATADVYASASGGTSPLPSSPLVSAVAQFTASPYKPMSTGPLALRLTSSGSTSVLVDATAPAGLPADRVNNLSAVGGSTIAGSGFTAIFFPAATVNSPSAGSAACTAKCAAAGVVWIVDRYPPTGF